MVDRLARGSNLLILSIGVFGFVLILFVLTPTGFETTHVDKVRKIYFSDNISTAHRKIISLFNEKYKDQIEVIPVNLPFEKFSTNERKQLLARSLRSKSTSLDIFAVDLFWVPRFAKWAEPLGDYFSDSDRENYLDYALETCFYEQKLVSIPLYIDIFGMYYRRDLLEQLPDH